MLLDIYTCLRELETARRQNSLKNMIFFLIKYIFKLKYVFQQFPR